MPNNQKIADELLADSSLWDVYRLTWKLAFPWGSVIPSVLLTFVVLWIYLTTSIETSVVVSHSRQVIDLGISFVTTILGFLIAGFTVFATITNPRLFVKMAEINSNNSGISWLKATFAIFMHTFAHYTWFLIAALMVKIFALPSGMLGNAILMAAGDLPDIKRILATIGLSIFSGWIVYLALLLQGFIFNIYHTCMLSISVSGENLVD
ncbi:hypothetical protein [Azonexus sp. R2A61]|uniref:hypothetical protein n=1 Tax=Azonexus sp. R2A61 TaxID=2744443 RepID=UPI001F16C2A9|nr:hypothetical protein [Azonexus sp. R2A61]